MDAAPDMCLNGIVFPDLTPKPAANDQICPSPVQIDYFERPYDVPGNKSYRIYNHYTHRDLSHLDIGWELVCDGKVVENCTLPKLNTPAGSMDSVQAPHDPTKVSGEAFLNFYAYHFHFDIHPYSIKERFHFYQRIFNVCK